MALHPAELIKRQANVAFKAGDYPTATSLYSHAMRLDAGNPLHVLNRAMAHLKLANWSAAERDATAALERAAGGGNGAQMQMQRQKAFFRRARARKAQGDLAGARADLDAFVAHGGKRKLADEEALADPRASSVPPAPAAAESPAAAPPAYEVKDTGLPEMGKGAFATRALHRGDLILAEKPLIRHGEFDSQAGILAGVERLSPRELDSMLALHNAHPTEQFFVGIFRTNSLPEGLCPVAARFNHSCAPNARYSWHAPSAQHRIFAIAPIAPGAEIRVPYIQGRHVYGSTRAARQQRFLTQFGFPCRCAACALEGAALAASDARRREVAILYEQMMTHDPRHHGARVLRDAVRAIRLMREDGYMGDADDFAQDAGGLCALHSDWESAKYWAQFSYDSRCAEFGVDHEHAARAKRYLDDLCTHPQAGMYTGQKFPLRV
ncbi:hypothetical protein DFH09DRAFT_1469165 [Mycena vulgaris]|nr:hypothetical protein DFH09DRAFT_1469165 [Mycena vulgaris]